MLMIHSIEQDYPKKRPYIPACKVHLPFARQAHDNDNQDAVAFIN